MLKIGLTGGIGSGKSLVSRIFSILGVPVFHSDEVSKHLINQDQEIIASVSEVFGKQIYHQGILDRKKLSEIVFKNKALLERLNSILHPAVTAEFKKWLSDCPESKYIIKEAAILFESGTYQDLDIVITVTAPENLRISRVMERDGFSEEEVTHRMRSQLDDEERIFRSNEIIRNDGQELVIPQVIELHNKFRRMVEGS